VGFEETRLGEYDVHIRAESLGVTDTWGEDGRRPILVSLIGPVAVTRLTKQWTDDHTAFQARDLSDSDYV
jgi:hypothetical protein